MAVTELDFYMHSKLELEKIDVLHNLIVIVNIGLFFFLYGMTTQNDG
jgi:uncharacterized membrane protein